MTPRQIRNLRERMGMSQDGFAEWCGLTGKHRSRNVYNWEHGLARPSPQREYFLEEEYYK